MAKQGLENDAEWDAEVDAPFADERYNMALDAFADEDFEKARTLLLPYLRDHPEEEDGLALLADIDSALGRDREAHKIVKHLAPAKDLEDTPSGPPGA
ncbi:MAG: hypothetical protein ACYDCK_15425 [Thermoplasmatota archaeon]